MVKHFFASIFHRVQEVWPVHGKAVEPSRHALEQPQFFSSEKVVLLFDFFKSITPFCSSATSVPGVATPRASVRPRAFQALGTCRWSGSYSILHCCDVGVLPKKLVVRDCDDSGSTVTTLLSSYALRSKLSVCFRSSRRPDVKKSSPCTSNPQWKSKFASLCGRNGTEKPRVRKILPPPNVSVVFSPTLGSIQRSVHRLSQFPTRLAALPWGPRPAIGRRRRCTPDVNGDAGLRRCLCGVEANWVASRSCPRFCFGGVLVHLPVPTSTVFPFEEQLRPHEEPMVRL